MFERTPEYMTKIVLDAFDKKVYTDAMISIVYSNGKLRAWCPGVKSFLQFPVKLRQLNTIYIADVVSVGKGEGTERKSFYRAYKGSIRKVLPGNKESEVLG